MMANVSIFGEEISLYVIVFFIVGGIIISSIIFVAQSFDSNDNNPLTIISDDNYMGDENNINTNTSEDGSLDITFSNVFLICLSILALSSFYIN